MSTGPSFSIGIVGAGVMGTAIAAAAVQRRLRVAITDSHPDALARAIERIAMELAGQGVSADGAIVQAVRRRVTPTDDEFRVAQCDLVVESVPEKPAVKQRVYSRLARHLGAGSILATNTSTIPIERLASDLPSPSRFCGMHFFHPVRRRPLVEIVRGPQTSDETIATAVAYATRLGKAPIVVADGPGFLVNRLLVPYATEALEMVLDGAAIDQIERAATEFGMAMGPLRLLDEIGLDTAFLGGHVLYQAFPARIVASPLMLAMYKAGRLGRKEGAGFFRYPPELAQDEPGCADPAVEPIVVPLRRTGQRFSDTQIAMRLLLPMVVEATRILEEGRVHRAGDIDLASVLGLGFPASRKGLLAWADTLGPQRILALLRPLQALGPRMEPTSLMLDMARRGRRFHWREAA